MLLAYLPPDETKVLVIALASIGALIFGSMLAFWIWMLRDCLTNELPGSKEKTVWAVVIVCMGLAGAFMYNVGRRKKRIKELGR